MKKRMPDWTPFVYPKGAVAVWNDLVIKEQIHPSLSNLQEFMAAYPGKDSLNTSEVDPEAEIEVVEIVTG